MTHSLTGRLTALTDYELYKTRFGIYLWSYVGAVDRVAAGKLSDGKDNGGIVGTDKGGKPKQTSKTCYNLCVYLEKLG